MKVKVAQSCPTLCNPMDYAVVYGILQARILDWVAFPFSRGSSQPRDQTQVYPHCRWILYQLSHKGSPSHGRPVNNIWFLFLFFYPHFSFIQFSIYQYCLPKKKFNLHNYKNIGLTLNLHWSSHKVPFGYGMLLPTCSIMLLKPTKFKWLSFHTKDVWENSLPF